MEQMMEDLPTFRTTAFEPCFTHTGVDLFGPLNAKRGRVVVTRWGVLSTCLNSRAVHLELASSLETDCFINVLRRFISRRVMPKTIQSNNATNLVGAAREIKEAVPAWNENRSKTSCYRKDVNGFSNHPKPHMLVESGRG